MNRIACLWLPHFVAQVERQRLGSGTRPLLVCDRETVLCPCAQAAARGVCRGDALQQALARCPDAQIVQVDHARYREVWDGIMGVLEQHSPLVEEETWGTAYLDARGMSALYGSETSWCQAVRREVQQEVGLESLLGVAATRFAAWVAARSSQSQSGYTIVSQNDRSYLSTFSVDWLPLSAETRRRLRLLGIQTIGQFANLPARAAAEQFGPENLTPHRWARGEDNRPLRGQHRQVLEAHLEFDVPETRQEPLLAAMVSTSQETLAYLNRRALTVQRVEMQVGLAEGDSLVRSAWIGDMLGAQKLQTVLGNLLADLRGHGSGIVEMRLLLVGLEPSAGRQLNLFAHTENRFRLEETLHKLAQKHSPGCVLQVYTKAPEAPIVSDQYALVEVAHEPILATRTSHRGAL